jgi:hypothetical protein
LALEVFLMAFDFKRYARRGAEARLTELAEEARSILSAFPELHRGDMPFERPARVRGRSLERAGEAAGAAGAAKRQRRKMTPAEREAVGERMRKYWAGRRKAAAK